MEHYAVVATRGDFTFKRTQWNTQQRGVSNVEKAARLRLGTGMHDAH